MEPYECCRVETVRRRIVCRGQAGPCKPALVSYNRGPIEKGNKHSMLRLPYGGISSAAAKWLVLALTVLLAGCAGSRQLTEQQASALEQRVHARWQTLIDRDFEKTWEYSTPVFRRTFPKSLYLGNFSYAVEWQLTGVEILNYDARAAVASVAVRVMSKPVKQTSAASRAIGAIPATIREKWLYIDGEWWYSANY
jgi:hypothetical protein